MQVLRLVGSMAIKNPIVKSQFMNFVEAEGLSGHRDDELFEMFSIFAIEQGMLNRNFEYTDIHFLGSEFGIDGAAIIVNGELITDKAQLRELSPLRSAEFHFFQSKSGERFKSGDIGNFFSAIKEFFDDNFESDSDDLNTLYAIKNHIYKNSGELEDSPSIKAFYVTTGSYKKPKEIEKAVKQTSRHLDATRLFGNVSIQIIDAGELQKFYRSSVRSIEKTITFKDSVVLPSASNTAASYLGFIEASEIVKLVTSESDNQINKSVFVDNIRDYNPNSPINKKISKSLSEGEGEMFVFRNNGITAVAKSIRPIGKQFTITDFQIVNGCQTSHVLFANKEFLDSVYVPFRLIEAKDDKTISSVIIGTNSQNPVKEEQLWALRPFMKDFEEYCASLEPIKRIYIERRDCQYRGNSSIPKTKIISLRLLMQSVASVLLFVGIKANRTYASVRNEYADKLFDDQHDLSIYHFAAYANIRYEQFWRANKIDKSFKIYKFYILTGIGMVLSGEKKGIPLYGKTVRAKAAAMSGYISDDDNFEELIGSITKKINLVMKKQDIPAGELRDFIKTEPIQKEILNSFKKIKNPLS